MQSNTNNGSTILTLKLKKGSRIAIKSKETSSKLAI